MPKLDATARHGDSPLLVDRLPLFLAPNQTMREINPRHFLSEHTEHRTLPPPRKRRSVRPDLSVRRAKDLASAGNIQNNCAVDGITQGTSVLPCLESVHVEGVLVGVVAIADHGYSSRHASERVQGVHVHPAHL